LKSQLSKHTKTQTEAETSKRGVEKDKLAVKMANDGKTRELNSMKMPNFKDI
jgi:hypothetical protein